MQFLFACWFNVQLRACRLNKPENRMEEVGLLSGVMWVSRSPALAGAGQTEATDHALRAIL